ncbi:MAG: hypothetical protein P8X55_14925, partial [Desulfosarcinaceae bacterium]
MNNSSIRALFLSDEEGRVELTDEIINLYRLEKWSKAFTLMTAGYRDQLDPEDFASPGVSFNA